MRVQQKSIELDHHECQVDFAVHQNIRKKESDHGSKPEKKKRKDTDLCRSSQSAWVLKIVKM